jgi:hypothetical protein
MLLVEKYFQTLMTMYITLFKVVLVSLPPPPPPKKKKKARREVSSENILNGKIYFLISKKTFHVLDTYGKPSWVIVNS